ncbi:MAG TPA: glycine-rich protein [Rubrobacter sp.]|nr:glycine-rich protein [Rubrobacter sp.]
MSTTRTLNSFFPGALAALVVALVAAMVALLVLAYDASPARAAGDCSTTSGTTTCTFGSTGEEDTFVVPAGVSSVQVVATGAPGAAGDFYPDLGAIPALGGLGAVVSGNLTGLTPGDTLYVNVGGAPTGGDAAGDCADSINCHGGFNGGGNASALGGGGGGASDVRYVSRDRSGSLASRLIVAAGGGGGGVGGVCMSLLDPDPQDLQPLLGGTGGDTFSDGGDGESCVVEIGTLPYIVSGGKGGKAGTQSAGGAGGAGGTVPGGGSGLDGESGSLGQGGSGAPGGGGAPYGGGGGGGGYYGGGGGGGSAVCPNDVVCSGLWSGAGGGGGGSNLVPPGGSGPRDTALSPYIAISYRAGGVGEPPPTEQPQSKGDCKKGGYEEYGFKNQGRCIKAVNHPR